MYRHLHQGPVAGERPGHIGFEASCPWVKAYLVDNLLERSNVLAQKLIVSDRAYDLQIGDPSVAVGRIDFQRFVIESRD